MTRTRLAAAAILTLGLLAPVATATSAAAAPKACGESVQVKDHKARAKVSKAKKKGHSKPAFVHGGTVSGVDATASTLTFTVRGGKNKALRGCTLTVVVTSTTKINRNDAPAALAAVLAGDHVNVKGSTTRNAVTGDVTYTATRISAESPDFESVED